MPYKVDASTQTSIPAISLQIQTNDFICVFWHKNKGWYYT
jgi:hypothetical protein